MSSQQRALIIPSPTAEYVLGHRPIPIIGNGQVLVKVMSAALNPTDWKKHAFDVLIDEYPAVTGQDIAGIVEDVGEGVVGFSKGCRVFSAAMNGGFQQYIALPAAILMPVPEKLSFDDVATIPVAFTAACVGLFADAPIGVGLNPTYSWDVSYQGQSALVIGGSTSVGQYATQLLKFLGFNRIIAYASKRHADFLRSLGATEVIDRNTVAVHELAKSPSIAVGVNVTYDSMGYLDEAYDCTVDGGKVVTAHPRVALSREGRGIALSRVQAYYFGPDVHGFSLEKKVKGYLAVPEHSTFGRLLIKNLPEMLEKGVILPNRYEVLRKRLSGIPEGLQRLKAGTVSGVKLIAHPQEE